MIEYIDARIAELRQRYWDNPNIEWRYRINELRRLREHLLLTSEKDNPKYLRNPSGLTQSIQNDL